MEKVKYVLLEIDGDVSNRDIEAAVRDMGGEYYLAEQREVKMEELECGTPSIVFPWQ